MFKQGFSLREKLKPFKQDFSFRKVKKENTYRDLPEVNHRRTIP